MNFLSFEYMNVLSFGHSELDENTSFYGLYAYTVHVAHNCLHM